MRKTKNVILFSTSSVLMVIAAVCCLFIGSVHIPAGTVADILLGKQVTNPTWSYIVLHSRMPQMITALLSGAGLSVCGLMMQTMFHNPLADPSILGISSGANLGSAFVLLMFGGGISIGSINIFGQLSLIVGALAGAAVVLSIIIWFTGKVRSNVMVLIIGVMIGYLASAVISILNSISSAQNVQAFVLWGLGDFSSVGSSRLLMFSVFTIIPTLISFTQSKFLNAFLLGEDYAGNLGINIRSKKIFILLLTGIITAVITAFCGPIAFIGLAVPHISRLLLKSSNHLYLIPLSTLLGSLVALISNILTMTGIPLNVITSLMGIPVIMYVIASKRQIRYMQ